MTGEARTIRCALISVSDKAGIVDLARELVGLGIKIISTGGTANLLADAGIPAVEVSGITGFPEIMDGRVKTLHPKVHGGILARRGIDDQMMQAHGIPAIDMVVVNLYPFSRAVADSDCTLEHAIEHIDIGGPAMIRAAAKNNRDVLVVTDHSDYAAIIEELKAAENTVSQATRFAHAIKAFAYTAGYEGAIASYFRRRAEGGGEIFPETLCIEFSRRETMRYGENPQQSGVFYIDPDDQRATISNAAQLQGRALSFNNIADADTALECVKQFDNEPACVIVKHANPCGVALAESSLQAYQKAYSADPESAFGGIIAFNSDLDGETCQAIVEQQFVEVIIAPKVSGAALRVAGTKRNIRVLQCDYRGTPQSSNEQSMMGLDYKRVQGGLLVQNFDTELFDEIKVVTQREPDKEQLADMIFAWKVAVFVKSNAIVYAKCARTIGIGAGQTSRVNSARIAAIKAKQAGLPVRGAVMASDAFFPFRDGIDTAAENGISAVIQPGGSMFDDEIIGAANEHDMAMIFTGMRHFRH